MTIISLGDTKNFLRVDFADDDTLIQTLISAAESHVLKATGISFDSTNQLAQTVCLMLVAEWYSNREIGRQMDAGSSSVLNSLMTQLALGYTDSVRPPRVPEGLTGLAEPGYVLVRWLANIDPNVDGYNVYRNGIKLNAHLVREHSHWIQWPLAWGDWPYPMWESQRHPGPGVVVFHDQAVQVGQNYSYQVTAVDDLGNESAQSGAVPVTT